MAADEEGRGIGSQCATYGCVVVARVATDMFDEDVGSLDGKAVDLRVAQADVAPIDVAMYGAEGVEGFEPLGHLELVWKFHST